MNQDFGVPPRPNQRRSTSRANFIDLSKQDNRPTIDISKYRPASQITAMPVAPQPVALAVKQNGQTVEMAVDDSSRNPLWAGSPADDDSNNNYDDDGPDPSQSDSGDKPPRRNPFAAIAAFFRNLSRKQWLIIGGVVLLLAAGLTAFLLTRSPDAKPAPAVSKKAAAPAPKPKSPLTGIEVSDEDTKRPVIGVMIENSTFARPQSGLRDAGVVYEAIAEYGITRFLALYQEANPANIGPVRSARPYYVDWARMYDAAYAHVGGSPEALSKIKAESIRDLDQFANSGAYRRIAERDAPHNVYTTGQQLRDLTVAKGWTGSTFSGLARKSEAAAKAPTATAIDIAISGPTYNVHYDYDAASNSYLRTMGGQPHTESDGGLRIAPKVVVAMATQYSLMADGYHSMYATTGSGAAKIFQDGTVTDVTWSREGNSQYVFKDAAGKTIALNPGQTWFTMVANPGAITHSGPPAPAAATPSAN